MDAWTPATAVRATMAAVVEIKDWNMWGEKKEGIIIEKEAREERLMERERRGRGKRSSVLLLRVLKMVPLEAPFKSACKKGKLLVYPRPQKQLQPKFMKACTTFSFIITSNGYSYSTGGRHACTAVHGAIRSAVFTCGCGPITTNSDDGGTLGRTSLAAEGLRSKMWAACKRKTRGCAMLMSVRVCVYDSELALWPLKSVLKIIFILFK